VSEVGLGSSCARALNSGDFPRRVFFSPFWSLFRFEQANAFLATASHFAFSTPISAFVDCVGIASAMFHVIHKVDLKGFSGDK
jgi:hypothetical protein